MRSTEDFVYMGKENLAQERGLARRARCRNVSGRKKCQSRMGRWELVPWGGSTNSNMGQANLQIWLPETSVWTQQD